MNQSCISQFGDNALTWFGFWLSKSLVYWYLQGLREIWAQSVQTGQKISGFALRKREQVIFLFHAWHVAVFRGEMQALREIMDWAQRCDLRGQQCRWWFCLINGSSIAPQVLVNALLRCFPEEYLLKFQKKRVQAQEEKEKKEADDPRQMLLGESIFFDMVEVVKP